jgi:flagellar protein FlaG
VDDRSAQPTAPAGATETASKSKLADGIKPSREDVSAAVKKMNDAMLGSSQSLQFSIDEDSKDIVVKVIDQSTKEVVRQIPSKEALQIAKSIDKSIDKMQQGLLIDHTA